MTKPTPTPQEWADQVARTLPPLTAEEAAAVGQIAARLDARRRTQTCDAA